MFLALAFFLMLPFARRDRGEIDPISVHRGDLVQTVEVEGELIAVRSADLGPPVVGYANVREFKIAFMVPESAKVKRDQPVISFDTQPLLKKLTERRAELAEVTQKIEQRQIDLRMRLFDLDQQLAQAEAALSKARLKADIPLELLSRIDARKAGLELAAKEQTLASLRAEREAMFAGAEAELRTLRSQQRRAQGRVTALEDAVKAMTVVAPQDGIVIYKSNWRGEKKKIGDSVWMMEKVISLPDLSELKALGDVDEADAGEVAVDQKVTLRLEARPDLDLTGRVAFINRTVRRKSWRLPIKVYRVEIELDRSDSTFMRPAMRFRGEIETARIPGRLLVPRDAVFLRARGTVVWLKGRFGWSERLVTLGRNGRSVIEVLSGVDEGAQISPVDLATEVDEGARGAQGVT